MMKTKKYIFFGIHSGEADQGHNVLPTWTQEADSG